MKQGEIDMLKATCDRLSASTTKKETELQNLSDKVQQLELQVSGNAGGKCLSYCSCKKVLWQINVFMKICLKYTEIFVSNLCKGIGMSCCLLGFRI